VILIVFHSRAAGVHDTYGQGALPGVLVGHRTGSGGVLVQSEQRSKHPGEVFVLSQHEAQQVGRSRIIETLGTLLRVITQPPDYDFVIRQ